jgi:hypothetical protein
MLNALDGIEDDLNLRSHGNSHEGRLQPALRTPRNSRILSRHELSYVRLSCLTLSKEFGGINSLPAWPTLLGSTVGSNGLLARQNH